MRQWYFLGRMKSRADWDRRYGRRPYTTVWCTGGSKFSVSYFYFPTTHNTVASPLTTPLRFSFFKVGLFKPGLNALLGNPHTPSSLDIDRYRKSSSAYHLYFLHSYGAPSLTPPTAAAALGEGLQDWVLPASSAAGAARSRC